MNKLGPPFAAHTERHRRVRVCAQIWTVPWALAHGEAGLSRAVAKRQLGTESGVWALMPHLLPRLYQAGVLVQVAGF